MLPVSPSKYSFDMTDILENMMEGWYSDSTQAVGHIFGLS